MKIFDGKKIKTYRNLEELVSSNVLVGRRDGLLLGIDERTIDELRNYMYKANMYNKQKEVLDKIKEHLLNYIEEWQDSEDEYVKGKIDLARDVLCDIEELLEEIE